MHLLVNVYQYKLRTTFALSIYVGDVSNTLHNIYKALIS